MYEPYLLAKEEEEKVCNVLLLSLSNEVLSTVADEKTTRSWEEIFTTTFSNILDSSIAHLWHI